MDKTGNYHSQETDTRTKNQTPHVLTHKWVLNGENTWTQGRNITQWGLLGDGRAGGDWRGITIGDVPNVDDVVMDAANHHGMCIPM